MIFKIVVLFLFLIFLNPHAYANGCAADSSPKGPGLVEYESKWSSQYQGITVAEMYFEARRLAGFKTTPQRLEAAWIFNQIIENKEDPIIVPLAVLELSVLRSKLGRDIYNSKVYSCYNIRAQIDYVRKYDTGYSYFEPAGGYYYNPVPFARKSLKNIPAITQIKTINILIKDMEGTLTSLYESAYYEYFDSLIKESAGLVIYPDILVEALAAYRYPLACYHSSEKLKKNALEKVNEIYNEIIATNSKKAIEDAEFVMEGFSSKKYINLGVDRHSNLCVKYVDP